MKVKIGSKSTVWEILLKKSFASWAVGNPDSKCFSDAFISSLKCREDPTSLETVLPRNMATLTISQVCGVVVGQEEKPTPKPM